MYTGGTGPGRHGGLGRLVGGAFEKLSKRIGLCPIILGGSLYWFGAIQEFLHTSDQFLRMKRLSNQLVRFDIMGPLGDLFVDYSGHQEDRRPAKKWVLLNVLAKLVSVFVRHDDVTDDGIGRSAVKLSDGGGHVGASDDVEIFTAKGDLDHLAHGGAVIDEIYIGLGARLTSKSIGHGSSLSAGRRCASSNSRMASSSKSVARRWTDRWFATAPATNL